MKSPFVLALLFVSLSRLLVGAEPVKSPLAVIADAGGADLQRSFIGAPDEVALKAPASFIAYRKQFTLAAVPQVVALQVFADARFLLWINGELIHRGPNRFDWHGPEYDNVDITRALRAGVNTIAVVVMGNGTVQTDNARMMKHSPGLTLRIGANGKVILRTDESWKWSDQTRYRPAKVDWAKIVDRVDMNVEDGDWTQPQYDDRAWKPAVKLSGDLWGPLSARRMPLLRDTPVEPALQNGAKLPVELAAGQELKFSMGRLVQAFTAITFEAEQGTQMTLKYAGDVEIAAKAGLQTYVTSDSCAFDGGAITVRAGRVKIVNLQLFERLYPFDVAGSFTSNDDLLNKLWKVCARSGQLFSEDSYVDCADRERAEWMDNDPPGFDITRTAFSAPGPDGKPRFADGRLLGEMLRRTALSVQPEGWVKAHTTSDRFDIHAKMEDRGCDWVHGARRYYESTGDAAIIREIWPVIVRQMNYFLERRTARGLVLAREWVVWGNPVGYVTCEGAGLNAFIYKALVDAAFLGQVIGKNSEAAAFAKAAADLGKAFNTVLWDEKTGSYFSGYYTAADQAKADRKAREMKLKIENERIEPTMFPALWALDQGLVPPERKQRVMAYLMANRQQADRIMMFYYLDFQLYGADKPELDTEVLATFRTRWKAMAEAPWQASWEEFHGASRAHIYGMFPGYFLSAYVLGVRPEMPAAKRRMVIEPRLGDLTSAEGTVVTEFGPVPVAWKVAADGLSFRVQVPAGVTATLRIPKMRERARVAFTGKPLPMREDGRYFVGAAGPGAYEGRVIFGTN